VYLVTGMVSMGTLALVGIGAGVGYGIGTWLSDQYEKRQIDKSGNAAGKAPIQLPDSLQVSVMQWQTFLNSRAAGAALTPPQLQQLFAEFARLEPHHARNVQLVQDQVHQRNPSAFGTTPVMQPGGNLVAAEV